MLAFILSKSFLSKCFEISFTTSASGDQRFFKSRGKRANQRMIHALIMSARSRGRISVWVRRIPGIQRDASIEIKECEDWIVKTSFYKDIWIGCNTMTKRPVVITLQIYCGYTTCVLIKATFFKKKFTKKIRP